MPGNRRPERQAALRTRLAAAGQDALLVTHLPNIRYLTGFSGSAGALVIGRDRTILVTDGRYALQVRDEAGDSAEVDIEPSDLWRRIGQVLKAVGPRRLGFEAHAVTVKQAGRLAEVWGGRAEPVEPMVEPLRVVKDDGEVDLIRDAARVAVAGLDAVLPSLGPGLTERTVAGRLEAALRDRGSEAHPFDLIVASGPRSALPHAATTDRVIGANELLLLDFGAQVGGYCSDLTRTVVLGVATPRQREVYQAVREAKDAATLALRPGIAGRDADRVARESLGLRDLSGAFTHSLGHGLGLELHEEPRLSRSAGDPLPAGAVVTVEPGVYLEGWGGVRLEDDAVLRPGGAELLSAPAPDLLELR